MSNVVVLAFACAAVPAASMMLGSWLLMRVTVGERMLASFQNLSAGLVLAAVASELFPMLAESKTAASMGGLTVGFVCGLLVTFGTEKLGNWLETNSNAALPEEDPMEAGAIMSSELLSEQHRHHILSHLQEFSDDVDSIDKRADLLLGTSLAPERESEITESIDEDVHKLGYKLDHCRRLLEGAESGAANPPFAFDSATLKTRCQELRGAVAHLNEHLTTTSGFDRAVVLEMHGHMGELDAMLDKFHVSVQQGFSFWLRRMPTAADDRRLRGAPLPRGMLAAVTVDAFVDGFLIGISTSVSLHTGLVLAAANVLEMGFVGAAFAGTVSLCTGTTKTQRSLAISTPPLVLVGGGIIGGAIGDVSRSQPAVFAGFVAFGVVALLFLVTHELLIEAHETIKEGNILWINLVFYLGIYLVLVFNRIVPG